MIESIMFFGIGFLVSSLLGLIILPLVHARAVRLTTRRIEASAPVSRAEIQADKDQLRAEFAMSTRRLELSVEQLKAKAAAQRTDLGRQTEAVNKLKAQLGEKSAEIAALNAREKTLQEQLRSTQEELGRATDSLRGTERKVTEEAELEERSIAVDSQRIEMVTLRTQVARLRDQISDLEQQVKRAEGQVSRERLEVEKATQDLASERSKVENLGTQLRQLQRQLAGQTAEAEMLEDLREELATADGHAAATQALRTEKTTAEAQLERGREPEHMENALLRERINDVSAQVASLTAALEGPDSPIAAILAGDTAAHDEHVNGAQNGAAPIALTRVNGSLADRIRALQSRAASRTGVER